MCTKKRKKKKASCWTWAKWDETIDRIKRPPGPRLYFNMSGICFLRWLTYVQYVNQCENSFIHNKMHWWAKNDVNFANILQNKKRQRGIVKNLHKHRENRVIKRKIWFSIYTIDVEPWLEYSKFDFIFINKEYNECNKKKV